MDPRIESLLSHAILMALCAVCFQDGFLFAPLHMSVIRSVAEASLTVRTLLTRGLPANVPLPHIVANCALTTGTSTAPLSS